MCLLLITITLPVFYPSFASLPAPQLEITMWLDIRNWLDLAQTGNGGRDRRRVQPADAFSIAHQQQIYFSPSASIDFFTSLDWL